MHSNYSITFTHKSNQVFVNRLDDKGNMEATKEFKGVTDIKAMVIEQSMELIFNNPYVCIKYYNLETFFK